MGRIVVLEVNELPLKILRWYGELKPRSATAAILANSMVAETRNNDDLGIRNLYPAQTWATMAMGVPFARHGIYRYADPKPIDTPLYWQLASEKISVGVVGSLHSSPLARLPGLRFCIPDTFASDPATLPSSLESLQAFSLSMTKANSRVVSSSRPLSSYSHGLGAAAKARLRPSTLLRLARIAGLVATKKVPGERLRTAHFTMMADVFERLVNKHDPDLSVLFTNHIAAAMHRYWFASFPEDWSTEIYDAEWRDRNDQEIPAALDEFDDALSRIQKLCVRTDRALVIISSMGQVGGEPLRDNSRSIFVVRDAETFLHSIGVIEPHQVRSAMAPQVSAEFMDSEAARGQKEKLEFSYRNLSGLNIEQRDNVLTVSYTLDLVDPYHLGTTALLDLKGRKWTASELGGEVVAVGEHRNGMHHPDGLLICSGSASASIEETPVDAREVAPAILNALGVAPARYHLDPSFSL